jgi:hypothetical protein
MQMMQSMSNSQIFTDLKKSFSPLVILSFVLMGVAGCSSSRHDAFNERIMAPEPPAFLMSPVSSVISSPDGMVADMAVEETSKYGTSKYEGKLIVKGSRFVLSLKGSDRTFVWDSTAHKGFAVSEALQGYSPISSDVYATEVVTASETAANGAERVNGYLGHNAGLTVIASDGSKLPVTIWRTRDLNGFPSRITIPTAGGDRIINLTNLKISKVSDALFTPPEGFTTYASTTLMTSELMMRHSKTRNARPVSGDGTEVPIGGVPQPKASSRAM